MRRLAVANTRGVSRRITSDRVLTYPNRDFGLLEERAVLTLNRPSASVNFLVGVTANWGELARTHMVGEPVLSERLASHAGRPTSQRG